MTGVDYTSYQLHLLSPVPCPCHVAQRLPPRKLASLLQFDAKLSSSCVCLQIEGGCKESLPMSLKLHSRDSAVFKQTPPLWPSQGELHLCSPCSVQPEQLRLTHALNSGGEAPPDCLTGSTRRHNCTSHVLRTEILVLSTPNSVGPAPTLPLCIKYALYTDLKTSIPLRRHSSGRGTTCAMSRWLQPPAPCPLPLSNTPADTHTRAPPRHAHPVVKLPSIRMWCTPLVIWHATRLHPCESVVV